MSEEFCEHNTHESQYCGSCAKESRDDYHQLRALCDEMAGALKCNETYHRLGGIDDCDPCKALDKYRSTIADKGGASE